MATVPSGGARRVKVAVIGDKQVGKTSLIKRYLYGNFSPHYIYTRGGDIECRQVRINNNRVHLVLIDAAGHNYVRSLIKTIYRDVQAILIVFDVTREDTLDSVQDWIKQIGSVNENNPPVLLVGNKQDMASHRTVQNERAEHESAKLRVPYFETSARTGHNVEETFKALLDYAWRTLYTPEESIVLTKEDIKPLPKEKRGCCFT